MKGGDLPIKEDQPRVVVLDRVLEQELPDLIPLVQVQERVAPMKVEEEVQELVTLVQEDLVEEEVTEEVKVLESERTEALEEVLLAEVDLETVLVRQVVNLLVRVLAEAVQTRLEAMEQVPVTLPEEELVEEMAVDKVTL